MFYLLQDQPLDLNAKAILSSLMLQSLTAKDDLKITPEIALHDFQIKRTAFYETIANLIAKGYLTRTSSSTYSLTDKSIKIISDFKNLLSECGCSLYGQEIRYTNTKSAIRTESSEYGQIEDFKNALKRYFNHVRENIRIESERKIVDFLENFSPYIYIYKYIFNYLYNINNLKKEKKEINKEKKEKIEKIEKRKIEKPTYPQSAVECEPYFESFIKEHKDTYPQLENLNVSLEAQEFFNYYSERSWKDKTHTPVKSVSRRVGTWAKNWAERNINFKPKAKSFLDQLRAGEVSGLDDIDNIDNKDVLDLDIEELPND